MTAATSFKVIIGLDVGKTGHHACALSADGNRRYFDKPLPQDESKLRNLFTSLQAHGPVLLVVDQPNTIGALPVAVARDCSVAVAYLPGLAMRKAAALHPGTAKTDKRDAFIIAETARTIPATLRKVDHNDEALSTLKALAGFDEDITRDCSRTINRLRSALLQIHPALERVFAGGTITRSAVLDLLEHYGGPTKLRAAGKSRVTAWINRRCRGDHTDLVAAIFHALDQQTVVVPGTSAIERTIPLLASNIKMFKKQRDLIAAEVNEVVDALPLYEILTSIPGVGVGIATSILMAVGDCSDFPDAAHLASYAGIAPTTRRSGTSIRGEHPSRAGNKRLKNALFRSAWISTNCHEASRDYYQRKRREGKRHNAAVMCLARRRCNMIYAMLTRKEFFRDEPRTPILAAA